MRRTIRTAGAALNRTLLALALLAACVSPATAAVATFADTALSDAAYHVRLLWEAEGVTLDAQVIVDAAEAGSVALVLAVPDALTADAGDSALFEALDEATQPVVRMASTPASGCDGEATLGEVIAGPDDTTTSGAEAASDVEVELLAVPNVKALMEGFEADGLTVPEATSALLSDVYVNELGFDVVVLRAQVPAGRVGIGPVSVGMRPPADGRVPITLPLGIGVDDELVPVTVWTQGGGRYHVENTSSVELDAVASAIGDQLAAGEAADYLGAMDTLTEGASGVLFVAEFASDLAGTDAAAGGASYVSRLHTRAPATMLKDARVALAKDGPDLPAEVEIPALPVTAAWLALFGLAAFALRRRVRLRPTP